jgi:hypothetical protein
MGVEFAFNAVLCCRLICHRGQTHTELFYVGAAGRRNGLCERRGTHVLALKHAAPRLRGLRLGLQTRRGSNHSTAHVGEANSRSNVFQIASRICLRAQPLEILPGEFRRPPDFRTLYGLKWARSVEKRHGVPISEARRCSACANLFASPAVGKFSRASSAGGRLHL